MDSLLDAAPLHPERSKISERIAVMKTQSAGWETDGDLDRSTLTSEPKWIFSELTGMDVFPFALHSPSPRVLRRSFAASSFPAED